ncbi:MAPEG family protein [Glaciecola petra]|uniref:MAPEG family protein n=1 Tax=Glaciecola petra TaxID=3075602 RepID=A0ABU2ZUB5_9ALTE|nr:MAPEG family protein [Aestuariibacter sp. P117]MDT0596233.1 MAPEG family protein [Aestuariibacter sp. P117]
MNYTILALIAYILWTMLLLLSLAGFRTFYNKANNRKSLKFDASGNDVGGFGERLTRAHANCYESFVFVAGPMIVALATGSAAITNGLAIYMILARLAQSIVHIASVANIAIILRFVFFLVQFGIAAYWLILLLQKFA